MSLAAEHRRCPRCGAPLFDERRQGERRAVDRRTTRPRGDEGTPGT